MGILPSSNEPLKNLQQLPIIGTRGFQNVNTILNRRMESNTIVQSALSSMSNFVGIKKNSGGGTSKTLGGRNLDDSFDSTGL